MIKTRMLGVPGTKTAIQGTQSFYNDMELGIRRLNTFIDALVIFLPTRISIVGVLTHRGRGFMQKARKSYHTSRILCVPMILVGSFASTKGALELPGMSLLQNGKFRWRIPRIPWISMKTSATSLSMLLGV